MFHILFEFNCINASEFHTIDADVCWGRSVAPCNQWDCLLLAVAWMHDLCYAGTLSARRLPCNAPAAVLPTSEKMAHHAVCSARYVRRVGALSAPGPGNSAMPIHSGH